MRFLVTGGAGFIGSSLVRMLIRSGAEHVTTVDKLTYAGNLDSLLPIIDSGNHELIVADIKDDRAVAMAFEKAKPDIVFHLAAESHVDRSINGPKVFVETNVLGTFVMLQEALAYWRTLPADNATRFRFVHVSTDEVFGSLGKEGLFTEATPYDPSSPYSATKAASDHLARAWHRTFGFPVLVTNCSNNYGPYQFPEKLIPHMIVRALSGETLPVYGTGDNVRDWLYVDDHAAALCAIGETGEPGQTYLISGKNEARNLELVRKLAYILDSERPRPDGKSYVEQIVFVADRPGHDFRYAIDAAKLEREVGWRPTRTLEEGLSETVRWYLNNEWWWQRILSGSYRTERLGLTEQL